MDVAPHNRLRVLVVDEEVPFPVNSGKRVRTWNLLRRLSARHDLHWLAYGPASDAAKELFRDHAIKLTVLHPLPPSKGVRFYGRLLANVFSRYPYSVAKHFTTRLQSQVVNACKSNAFDLVHFEWTPYARCESPGIPRVIAAHNVESEIWRRRAEHDRNFIGRRFFRIQARRMEAFEREAVRQSEHVVGVSESDAEIFRSYGARNVSVVPNGVDLEYFQPVREASEKNLLVFVGALDWYPNIDAVAEFARKVLPLLRERNPEIKLRVVGRRPDVRLAAQLRQTEGVDFVGDVPDVRPYLAHASAVVVPLRIGGGTRIKILESLAMAKPVVSTTIGVEGLAITENRDFLLANTAEEFIRRIPPLLANPEQQARLGQNGRALVERLYGWVAAAEKLENAWLETAHGYQLLTASPVLAGTGALR